MGDFTNKHQLFSLVEEQQINKTKESIYDERNIAQLRHCDYEVEFAFIEAIKNEDFDAVDALYRRFSKYADTNYRISFVASKSTLEIFKLFDFTSLIPFFEANRYMHPIVIATSNNNIPILEYLMEGTFYPISKTLDNKNKEKFFALIALSLQYACQKGHVGCVNLLLSKKIKADFPSTIIQDTLETLVEYDNINLVPLLLDFRSVDFCKENKYLEKISTNMDVMLRVIRHPSVQNNKKNLDKKYNFFNEIAYKHYQNDRKFFAKSFQQQNQKRQREEEMDGRKDNKRHKKNRGTKSSNRIISTEAEFIENLDQFKLNSFVLNSTR